ncbi:alcohol dehydrogenase class IV [Melghirimyces profundicolus]|uniref:Alcohol dehydrogenase class IV n=1 Tax=Melghirimyces profundicolus TaxID=1242148 RepID=A0A2T6C7Y3_9BACL|nr:iron-containing alcohol dehydrogenase [Melghirimyces profundicolus]PTX64429.1 alcohol dehydrogenase class IV [Melghirimyces profundicolus]
MKPFVSPKKIVAEEGSIQAVEEVIRDLNPKRVLIFADPVVVEVGLTQNLEALLGKAGVEYKRYTDIQPEPPLEVGDRAVETLREYRAELVIGIGGGSCLDITKAAAVLATHEGSVSDYLNLSGTKTLTRPGIPKILIPTTSGTGAEVTDIAVFSLEDTKDVITHEFLLADMAIIDPELTYTLPPRVTAASGVDAFTHAVEAFVSIHSSTLTDTLALEAIRKIHGNLRTAVWNGSDKTARREMAWGSLIAGLSFYNAGVAGVHALAYPLGGLFKIPHGESNAVLLPYVFDYVWPSCLPKMKVLAKELGLPLGGVTDREAAKSVVQALRDLVTDVGLPTTLKEYGIKEKDLDILAENGIEQKRLLARSPRPFDVKTVRQVYEAAYKGELNG